jgi:hypothetical protein
MFGVLVNGLATRLFIVTAAGLLLYAAWGLYQLRARAWWIALAMVFLGYISNILTIWRADLAEVYAQMGYKPEVAAAAARLKSGPGLKWLWTLLIIPWAAWLLYLRRYFIVRSDAPAPSEGEPPVHL